VGSAGTDQLGTSSDEFDEARWTDLITARVLNPDRLAAVAETHMVESELEAVFDRLTQLASAVLHTPWAFVTLVDDRRSFWKSCFGTGAVTVADRQNPVDESFCQYVVATGDTLLIDDARLDDRTRSNPSIVSMGVLAWAGSPLLSASGEVLGTFCVVSDQARRWTADDEQVLETLAAAAASEIQLRTALQSATATAAHLAFELAARAELGRRSQFMADFARQLSAADSTTQIAGIVSSTGRDVISAVYVNLHLVDASTSRLSIIHSPSVPDDIVERYQTLPIDESTASGCAVVRGTPVFASTMQEYAAQWPDVAADAAAIGARSAAAWPLFRSDGSVMGALSIGWPTEVEFTQLLRAALATLAQISAAAIERGQVGEARHHFVIALQHALLPGLPQLSGLDTAARYLPANSELGFGGDWYDVISITPTVTAVVVGDVCGHGIDAAATMALLRGSINALVRLNVDSLESVFDQAESWLPGPADFVATVAVHLIDTATDTMSYVSAGHPPSIVIDRDGQFVLLESGRRRVLGAGGDTPTVGRAQFGPGSVLIAYTDGLVERRGETIDDGIDRVVQCVLAQSGRSCEQTAVALERSIHWVPTDDVAFAIVARTAD
jgi:putative methionine-R-sulfoxide reductase with GAF domain